MALIKCPECGKEVSDTCETCIHCGYQLKQPLVVVGDKKEEKENKDNNNDNREVIVKRLKSENNASTGIILIVVGVVLTSIVVGLVFIGLGIYYLVKGDNDTKITHDIVYYDKENKKIYLYSSEDKEYILDASDITNIKYDKGDSKLTVTIVDEVKPISCGSCTSSDYETFKKLVNDL